MLLFASLKCVLKRHEHALLANPHRAKFYKCRSLKSNSTFGSRAGLVSQIAIAALLVTDVPYAKGQSLPEREAAVSASSYRLAPQDKLKLRILEWRPTSGEFNEWTALNDEYVVDASGGVFIPLIGLVQARGLTTTHLSSIISQRMKRRVGLATAPDVSIEIATYRPIYIVGDVQERGEFPYRPGLTATRALAIAGGVFRDAARGATIRREKIAAESSLKQAQLDLRRMLVRRSRLNSEITFVESGEFDRVEFQRPKELQSLQSYGKLLRDEERIMKARMSGYKSKHAALRALRELLEKERGALAEKMHSLGGQIHMAKAQNEKIEKLWKKSLVVSTARLESQRALAELERAMLDLETTKLRVELELSKAHQDLEDTRHELMAQATTELQEVESKIDLLRYKVATEQALVRVSLEMMPANSLLTDGKDSERVGFTIKRALGDGTNPLSIVAKSDTPILPGDVVHVAVKPLQENASKALVGSSRDHPLGRPGEAPAIDRDL